MIGVVSGEGEVGEDIKKTYCHFHILTLSFERRHENKSC